MMASSLAFGAAAPPGGTLTLGRVFGTIPLDILRQLLLQILLSGEALPDQIRNQNHGDEHERCRPRQLHLVLKRHAREVVDQHGQRSSGLHQIEAAAAGQPEIAEQGGKQQWRGLTGVMLAVARAAGETAPLLFTALFSNFWLTSGGRFDLMQPTASLAVLIYNFSGMPFKNQVELAWAAALVLVAMVLITNLIGQSFSRQQNLQ